MVFVSALLGAFAALGIVAGLTMSQIDNIANRYASNQDRGNIDISTPSSPALPEKKKSELLNTIVQNKHDFPKPVLKMDDLDANKPFYGYIRDRSGTVEEGVEDGYAVGTVSICELIKYIVDTWCDNDKLEPIKDFVSSLLPSKYVANFNKQYNSICDDIKEQDGLETQKKFEENIDLFVNKYLPKTIDNKNPLEVSLENIRRIFQNINYIINFKCTKEFNEQALLVEPILDNGDLIKKATNLLKKELSEPGGSPLEFIVSFPGIGKKITPAFTAEVNNKKYNYKVDRVVLVKNNLKIKDDNSKAGFTDAIIAEQNGSFYMYDPSRYTWFKNIYKSSNIDDFFKCSDITIPVIVLYKRV